MKDWMKVIPAEEFATYTRAGFGGQADFGKRPALIVVDVTMGFCGSKGLSLEEAIAEFTPACGPAAWEAMPRIARLIRVARTAGMPIVFTRSALADVPYTGKATKSKRKTAVIAERFNAFPDEVAPLDGEWVLHKTKASGFFSTPLTSYLVAQGVDTTIICGTTTSGCVRATTVDSFSHGYRTVVVDDCCFDRSSFAHAANLFDMSAKYGSVVSVADLEQRFAVPHANAAE
jgi:nicotinamidase-related amidase